MIISDNLGYAEAFEALEPASQRLGRKINPTVYSHAELAKRIKQKSAFATRVLTQDKMWLIGSESSLRSRLSEIA